jgi:hypothetical protein
MLNLGEMPSFGDEMTSWSCRGSGRVEGQKRADAEAGEPAGVHLPARRAARELIVGIGMCKFNKCRYLDVDSRLIYTVRRN